VGLGRWIEAQRTWFAELAGYSELKKDAHFTDKLLMLGVRQVTHHAGQLEYEGTKDVIFSMLKGLAIALWPLAKRLFIPAVILVPLCIKFRWTIMAEQAEFKKRWKEDEKERIWGKLSRANPMTGWDTNDFAPETAPANGDGS